MPNKIKWAEIDPVREKLIELCADLETLPCCSTHEGQADYLIANCVTLKDRDIHWATEQAYKNGYEKGKQDAVAKGNNVPSKWISVKDRLPEQGQEVIVYSGGVLKPTVFAYQFWNKHYDSWARITHWMPLPQPPKGE